MEIKLLDLNEFNSIGEIKLLLGLFSDKERTAKSSLARYEMTLLRLHTILENFPAFENTQPYNRKKTGNISKFTTNVLHYIWRKQQLKV